MDRNNDGQLEWYRDANGDGINDLIVDCGNLKGLENSYLRPHTLNESGSIAGGSWHADPRDGLGYQRAAWLWKNGVFQSLQSLTGGTTEFRDAYAINNAGQIICQASGTRRDPGLKACILLPTR